MKHLLLFLLLTTSLLPQSLFDKIGGASSKNPEDFYKKASPEAIELVKRSYTGLDASKLRDYHTHIVGIEENKTGAFINPKMRSPLHIKEYIRF
jgi:hypothetical protein